MRAIDMNSKLIKTVVTISLVTIFGSATAASETAQRTQKVHVDQPGFVDDLGEFLMYTAKTRGRDLPFVRTFTKHPETTINLLIEKRKVPPPSYVDEQVVTANRNVTKHKVAYWVQEERKSNVSEVQNPHTNDWTAHLKDALTIEDSKQNKTENTQPEKGKDTVASISQFVDGPFVVGFRSEGDADGHNPSTNQSDSLPEITASIR